MNQDRISARIPNAAFLFGFLQFKDVVTLCQLNRNWVQQNWAQTKTEGISLIVSAYLKYIQSKNPLNPSDYCKIFDNEKVLGVPLASYIRRLSVRGLTDEAVSRMESFTALQRLNMPQGFIKGTTFYSLSRLNGLRCLDLTGCSEVVDSSLVHLKNILTLRSLDFNGCQRISDNGLVHLAGLSNIRYLNFFFL